MSNLHTERLRIEPLQAAHADLLFVPLQDPSIYTFIPQDPPSAADLQRQHAFLAGGKSPDGKEAWLNWVAFVRSSQTPVGTFQATVPQEAEASIAYTVLPAFWRQGYAREIASCLIEHIFVTYNIPGIYAEIDTRNTGSIRLVESLGLSRVATMPNVDFFKGTNSDEYKYAIRREDWRTQC